MRQEAKEYPSFPLGNRLYIRLGLYSPKKNFIRRVRKRKITRPAMLRKLRTNSSSSMMSSISWTFLNDAMAISTKVLPKNHTNKKRFAAVSSSITTGILTLLFPRKRRRSSPSSLSATAFLEAVASWMLKRP